MMDMSGAPANRKEIERRHADEVKEMEAVNKSIAVCAVAG
jgi:hypothetical protein